MKSVASAHLAPSILILVLWITHGVIWRWLWLAPCVVGLILMYRAIKLSWRNFSERSSSADQ